MKHLYWVRWALACVAMGVIGCDTLMTGPSSEGDDFVSPFEHMSPNLNAAFVEGAENFRKVFTVEEGLGPIFNNTSCGSCHLHNGKGTPNLALVRFSRGLDPLLELGGPQLQEKAIPGVPPEALPEAVDISLRIPPPIFGMGLIEAIPEETIRSHADPEDLDGDGISGVPNWVASPGYVPSSYVGGGGGVTMGRFAWKANAASLLQLIAEAYHQDIGITSDFIPAENPHPQGIDAAVGDRVPDPEISASTVLKTVVYIRLLAPPARGEITPAVRSGEALFVSIGCVSCHVPSMRTGPNSIPQLDEVDVGLYSDLLLHDLGAELADNRPDMYASGREWRTPPLWGLRLVPESLDGQEFYLHDGRATTLDEAIYLHGGEALLAREAYIGLDENERQDLIAFLKSL